MRSLGIDGADAAGLTGACAKAWPYFAKGCSLAGKGVRQSLLGTSRRRDARRQVSYNGRPLYYYVRDKKPGQVLCQNVDEFGHQAGRPPELLPGALAALCHVTAPDHGEKARRSARRAFSVSERRRAK